MSLRARLPISSRSRTLALSLGLASGLAATVASNDARACGGCFHEPPPPNPPPDTQTTLVAGHRMAVSISTTQTVLWDQVQYTGSPKDFAWVLPVKAGARIELSTDAWFEALDATTATRVTSPALACQGNGFSSGGFPGGGSNSGCDFSPGCGAADSSSLMGADAPGSSSGAGGGGGKPPPVTVEHQGTVGPYDTVTLHANDPNALPKWLTDHGYAIDADVAPIIDAYTTEGFDFIALRLSPTQGVQQMKPVRVVSPGAAPVLPLRMVAAGTGANVAVTLFVIGEGRWDTENFPGATVDPLSISWDFPTDQSNYGSVRKDALAQNQGRTWLTTFAQPGALLSPLANPNGGNVVYQLSNGSTASSIADAYVLQGALNGETVASVFQCEYELDNAASSSLLVVDTCTGGGAGGAGGASSSGGAGGASSSSGTGGASSSSGTGGASSSSGTGGASSSSGAGGASSSSGTGGAGTGGAQGAGGAGGGVTCGNPGPNEMAAIGLACGSLDDVAVALTGMHPSDVWLVRLEAALPRAALKDDLVLQASQQSKVQNWLTATKGTNPPCPLAAAAISPGTGASGEGRRRRDLGMAAVVLLALALAISRRALRSRFSPAAARA